MSSRVHVGCSLNPRIAGTHHVVIGTDPASSSAAHPLLTIPHADALVSLGEHCVHDLPLRRQALDVAHPIAGSLTSRGRDGSLLVLTGSDLLVSLARVVHQPS